MKLKTAIILIGGAMVIYKGSKAFLGKYVANEIYGKLTESLPPGEPVPPSLRDAADAAGRAFADNIKLRDLASLAFK